jgi:hypothetical protein
MTRSWQTDFSAPGDLAGDPSVLYYVSVHPLAHLFASIAAQTVPIVEPTRPGICDQLPAGLAGALAGVAVAGLPSASSICSIERRLVSKPMNQKAKAPRTYQKAK